MLDKINRWFDPNQRKVNQLKPIVARINAFESGLQKYSDLEITSLSQELKQRVRDGLNSLDLQAPDYRSEEQILLDGYLPEAFSLVREAFRRIFNERSYDEQLMVGILLHQGNAAEQKTGEGKTHAGVHPMYLNSLTGRGAHLVTVNDYLARRDAEWMGLVYSLLGVSVGCINSNGVSYLFDSTQIDSLKPESGNWREFPFGHGKFLKEVSRRDAYAADVTYGTNNEFGFDYLRDNMVHSRDQVAQVNSRGEVGVHHFAIVDEVDSILIDEARTPLIISSPAEESNELYQTFSGLVKKLNAEDYKLDEKSRSAFLLDLGVKKIEKWLGIENVYEDFMYAHHLEQALKAEFVYKKDIDYVVQNDQVVIVDEFTGRLMEGRRYSEGLHQAIEAKEGVAIQKESKTVATITFQNYFRLYEKLAGMSATILTESEEFHKIYKLNSVSVPTHRTTVRKDYPDRIYKNQRAKWKAIADEIAGIHSTGQPILVGTTSVENNELVSQLLNRRGIRHEVLNAKNHEREADIISQAGRPGSVTVATNMAGRGTDIKLGNGVKEMGGLHVIGTERHESRRIDNQLRGRAGRQGDPGSSRFFVALDDNLMRIFNGDRIAALMDRFNLPDDIPIEHAIVSRSIESAQQKVEGYNFDIRKHLVEYDDVINKQREIIYRRRRRLLDLGEQIDTQEGNSLETELRNKAEPLIEQFPEFEKNLEDKKQLLGPAQFGGVLRFIFLNTIDQLWMEHIDRLDELRAGIGLRGYGQRDPLVEFKNEAYRLFERLIYDIDTEIVSRFYNLRVQISQPIEMKSDNILEKANEKHEELNQFETPKQETTPIRNQINEPNQSTEPIQLSKEEKTISRNDPCPCGSGKKWKNCGLVNTSEHLANMQKKR
ncbi:preprotein translocase subunit SecA [candidate division WWE3 bacterium]|nr:preprotein translocase subunit SecA [candidate division WWE3 bacterium]